MFICVNPTGKEEKPPPSKVEAFLVIQNQQID